MTMPAAPLTALSLSLCSRRKQDEVQVLEESIRQRSEQQKKAGVELDATCHICLKTKFADGVGHVCHYCNIRCCARCGGKVTLRSNKVSILLRKAALTLGCLAGGWGMLRPGQAPLRCESQRRRSSFWRKTIRSP